MSRVYNFGAGPAMLPDALLKQVQDECLEWQGLGMSVMEVSHRSGVFKSLMSEAEQDLRDLLNVPDNYHVLFTLSPARAHYALLPLNLLGEKGKADYLVTGQWSAMAFKEAERYGDMQLAATGKETNFTTIPSRDSWQCRDDAGYFFYVANETIHGVELHTPPSVGDKPLVVDMTSNILCKPLNINDYGCIIAGVQKNVAVAGMTIVIVRDDLLKEPHPLTPSSFRYDAHVEHKSLAYTPAVFSCYTASIMFKWLKAQGGLETIAEINQRKAKTLYDAIDESGFYTNPVEKAYRSMMNIPFILANDDLTPAFIEEAQAAGLTALKGHRNVGGLRASIYNAMPLEGVEALVDFMKDFERRHG